MAISPAGEGLDLATVTHQAFADCMDQQFLIHHGDSSIATRLVSVAPWGNAQAQRQAFSLTFRGPNEPVLPQRIYAVENQTLGTMEIFLVPVGPDKIGMQYEAVFS